MLKELRRFKNFGTPNYFFELFSKINENQEVNFTIADIEKLFFNRVIDGKSIFDGCLELAIKIQILNIDNEIISLNSDIAEALESKDKMIDKFIECLFKSLKEDKEFHNVFCSNFLTYDILKKSFQINNQAFGLRYSTFKQLLIDFQAILPHPNSELNNYLINSRYKKYFDISILPEIKRRKLGIEEFRQTMEQQQIFGEEAERFVLNYEYIRLKKQREIDWVAEYIVNEGYDIASYNNISDKYPNRFIEVKSYDGEIPYFFWSRNEFTIARLKKDEYWLYLVNRSQLKNKDYSPLMIQNPYETILKNDFNWDKQIEKYKIDKTLN